ncbi:inter-alpha-trypsin inhibitor heavy chain H4-like isoform X2 [Liolophura sinensis]|uniref:inter-alpha-trypsin inhibitor heavy chain H4-like isoform X2 n=1 Tax=Liolophura sinensis TaxID=3198878 RepID=UPI0031594B4E
MLTTVFLLVLLSVAIQTSHAALDTGQITIDSLHIRSDIRHRFSETRVTSRVSNTADIAQDATFEVRLPDDAFISGYSMTIDGVVYPGTVKEKSAANKEFNDAVERGESAGKVAATSARETNEFLITVNVAAHSHVTFNLTYQELLQRRLGLYEHVIYINPGQIVPDLQVHVFINETREITQLSAPEIRDDKLSSNVITDTNKFARIDSLSPSSAQVTFSPTAEQQQEYSDRGVAGQFIVNYDVQRSPDFEGELLVSDGYFVHFFAPEDLPPMGKRIVFVLDTSGSMSGRKNLQLQEALLFILGELRPIDGFSILLFSSGVEYWGSGKLIRATEENVAKAKQFARTIGASGGTNINAALLAGLRTLSPHATNPSNPSLLLFLTDGQATSGETRSEKILENVSGARQAGQSIYSLAFGNGADFDLLRKLSAQNQGVARKIFEDADAALQLSGFYNEISSPLLSELVIKYISDFVNDTSLTQTSFSTFFRGSEIVVSGRYNAQAQGPRELSVVVQGNDASSPLLKRRRYCLPPWLPRPLRDSWYHPRPWPCPPLPPPPTLSPTPPTPRPTTFIERLWVYLTIRQLVEKVVETDNPKAPASVKAKADALRLALKYQFVTPYTSMVATKPKNLDTKVSFGPTAVKESSSSVPSSLNTSLRRSQGPLSFRRRMHPSIIRPNYQIQPPPAATLQPILTESLTTPPPAKPRSDIPPGLSIEVNVTKELNLEVNVTTELNPEVNATTPDDTGFSLCLDIASTYVNESDILLLNDTENDLVVTGILQTEKFGDHRKFESVSVRLNGSDVLTVAVTLVPY